MIRHFLSGQWSYALDTSTTVFDGRPMEDKALLVLNRHAQHFSHVIPESIVKMIDDGRLSKETLKERVAEFDAFVSKNGAQRLALVQYSDYILQFLVDRADWQNPSRSIASLNSDSDIDLLSFLKNARQGVERIVCALARAAREAKVIV